MRQAMLSSQGEEERVTVELKNLVSEQSINSTLTWHNINVYSPLQDTCFPCLKPGKQKPPKHIIKNGKKTKSDFKRKLKRKSIKKCV